MRIRYRNTEATSDPIRKVVEREASKLDSRLAHVEDDLRMLSVSMEHHMRDDSRTASLRLSLPGQELVAAGRGPRDDTALRDAFADLQDRLDTYLAKLRGEPAKRREGKFHRDKAELTTEVVDAGQGWPPEPPVTADEAEAWGKPPADTTT